MSGDTRAIGSVARSKVRPDGRFPHEVLPMRRTLTLLLLLLGCTTPHSIPPSSPPTDAGAVLGGEALQAIAQAYREAGDATDRGDWRQAATAFQRALAVNPGDDSLLYAIGSAWAQAGQAEEAFVWLDRLAASNSTLVPQSRDFPRMEGERFTRIAKMIQANAPTPHAPVAFTVDQRDLIPEGIAYDAKTDTFFLSSIRLRKVVAVGPDGVARDFATQGLMATLGLRVDPVRRLLWVASAYTPSMKDAHPDEKARSALHAVELDSGRERVHLPVGGDGRAHLLNDLAVGADGTVYATDSPAGEVLRLSPGASQLDVLVSAGALVYPNGITLSDDGRTLFIADFEQGLSALRLDTGKLTTVSHPAGVSTHGFDGLYFHGGALIGVENGSGPGRVMRLVLAPTLDRVVRTEVLEAAHPLANIPTTGALARGALYLIANSQLHAFRGERPPARDQLEPVHVVRVPLKH